MSDPDAEYTEGSSQCILCSDGDRDYGVVCSDCKDAHQVPYALVKTS